MWLERFMIIVVSLHRDYMPSAWGMYRPTVWDTGTLLGTLGLFLLAFLLFLRLLPAVSMSEAKLLARRSRGGGV
jgi:molybdopterin-containing oxidoreductase family membrane subunit